MEFGREAVAEHLVKNNMPTSEKLKKAFKEFVDDDWIAKDLEKCHERIIELRDKTLLDEFARKMHLLLAENGVKVVGNIVDDMSFDEENNIYFRKSELAIEHLDFSEHDKVFEDRIKLLKERIEEMEGEKKFLRMRCMEDAVDAFDRGSFGALTIVGRRGALEAENKLLKQRIAELEREKTEKPAEINFNDQVKVKLTPLGVEIYYHQYDELNKKIKENGGKTIEPSMPQIDKDGYTKFTLWHFMELYGEHIGMCKPNVVSPLYIELCPDEWKIRYDKEAIEKGEKKMKLIVGKSVYRMRKSEFKKVLLIARKNVPHGIYGVLKGDIGELKNEVYNSAEELEEAVNKYKKDGFEVFYNV